jgi:hypothetical protein
MDQEAWRCSKLDTWAILALRNLNSEGFEFLVSILTFCLLTPEWPKLGSVVVYGRNDSSIAQQDLHYVQDTLKM